MRNIERQRLLDHERYMRHREERLKRQHEYYLTHKEQCKAMAKRCYLRKLGIASNTDKELFTQNLVRFARAIGT